jgi:hypothetical protein
VDGGEGGGERCCLGSGIRVVQIRGFGVRGGFDGDERGWGIGWM